MLTLDKGAIKTLVLPENFVLAEEEYGGMGFNWRRQYVPKGETQIEITSFYRGRPAAEIDSEAFRTELAKPQHEIFTQGKTDPKDAEASLSELWGALGNAGNNQITNEDTGISGPRFYLESARTLDVQGRRVLVVGGYFHGVDGDLHNWYCGIFIDGSPEEDCSQIEELVFQADTKELYDKYFPEFWKALDTIEWS
jgi:hypothetical protein